MTDGFGRALLFHGTNVVAKCPSFSQNTAAVGCPCIPRPNVAGRPSYWLNPDPAYASVDGDRTFTDADAAKLAAPGLQFRPRRHHLARPRARPARP